MCPNWLLVERGLKTQLKRPELAHRPDLIGRLLRWEEKIIDRSNILLDRHGPREYYNPINGNPQRLRVKNFGWSNLGRMMLKTPSYP